MGRQGGPFTGGSAVLREIYEGGREEFRQSIKLQVILHREESHMHKGTNWKQSASDGDLRAFWVLF